MYVCVYTHTHIHSATHMYSWVASEYNTCKIWLFMVWLLAGCFFSLKKIVNPVSVKQPINCSETFLVMGKLSEQFWASNPKFLIRCLEKVHFDLWNFMLNPEDTAFLISCCIFFMQGRQLSFKTTIFKEAYSQAKLDLHLIYTILLDT